MRRKTQNNTLTRSESLSLVTTARALAPTGTDGPCEEAMRLLARGRPEKATLLLEQASIKFPNDASIEEALGHALLHDGRLEQAERAFSRAVHIDGTRASAHCGLSDVYAARGQRKESEQSIRAALAVAPKYGHAWLRLAHLRRFREKQDPDFRQLRTVARESSLGREDQKAMWFAMAKAYDDLHCPQDAFRYMRMANDTHRKDHPYDITAMQQLTKRVAAVCDQAFFKKHSGIGSDSCLPVFIVGLPRSGSSLVERIVASHPSAQGVGELPTMPRLAADLSSLLGTKTPFPECLREMSSDVARNAASEYLRRLTRDGSSDTLRICDKMLSNLVLIGMIAVLFPRARIVHCKRNLMDIGLSMYQQLFRGSGMGYSYDLEDIGKDYQMTQALMAHWKRVCPIPLIEVEYEKLVRDPEQQSRSLLDALGLPWDDSCLDANQRRSSTQTVSNWQVRQPVHTRSVNRWQPYAKYLEPLRKYVRDGE